MDFSNASIINFSVELPDEHQGSYLKIVCGEKQMIRRALEKAHKSSSI